MNRLIHDDVKLKKLQNRILTRKGLLGCGREFTVALHGTGKAVYTGSNRNRQQECRHWEETEAVFCTDTSVVGLMKNGTLRICGRHSVYAWYFDGLPPVCGVSCSATHTAILLDNGRVTIYPVESLSVRKELAEWPDVIDVVCGHDFTLGLTEQGKVVVAGGSPLLRHTLKKWSRIAGIFSDAEGKHVYGITAEGGLVSTARLPRRTAAWKNLVFVAASGTRLCAVTSAGRMVATAPPAFAHDGRYSFVACALASDHVAALTRDGRVLAEGVNDFGQCDTPRFGLLYESFEELVLSRQEKRGTRTSEARVFHSRLTEAERFSSRMVCGVRMTACVTADGRVLTTAGFSAAKQWSGVRALACGNAHLVALHENGQVSADGNDTDGCTEVGSWQKVKAVAAGRYHTLGLTEDGRVLFCGRNDKGQGDVSEWREIRRIYASDEYTVGLGCDGVLYFAGEPPFDASFLDERWLHPVSVAVSSTHMAILRADGTVLSTRTRTTSGRPGVGTVNETSGWHHIRSIAVGTNFTVGLTYGGRALAVGDNQYGQCNLKDWPGMVYVGCGHSYTVGLTVDGRVLTAGVQRVEEASPQRADRRGEPRFGDVGATDAWREVLAVSAGPEHTVALTRNGAVLAMGSDGDRQCSATDHFSLFRDIRQLYGYEKFRKASEGVHHLPDEPETVAAEDGQDASLIPFSLFASHLRLDTQDLLSRLSGNDEILSVVTEDGTPAIYRYETAEILREELPAPVKAIASADSATVYVCADGSARLRDHLSPQAPLSPLPNRLGDSPFHRIAAVTAGKEHHAVLVTEGSASDRVFGTVRCFGNNDRGQCDTGDWRDVIAVCAGDFHTVGLRTDGTVVAVGARRRDTNIRGRGRSGSAVAHLPRANPCAVEDWRNVSALACGGDVTLGLCHDGRVLSAGSSHYGQCNTDDWRGVISVATSGNHTVALFRDGHVEAVGLNESGECKTEDWTHVVQIAVMPELTLGLRSDGKLLAAGRHHTVLETLTSGKTAVRAIACFGTCRQVFVMADGTLRIHMRGSEFLPDPIQGVKLFTPSTECSVLDRYTVCSAPDVTRRRILGCFAVGMSHGLTLGQGGQIVAKGANDNGQCDVKAYGHAVWVAAGPYHSAVITADGRAVLTGRNPDERCHSDGLNRELEAVGSLTVGDNTRLTYAWRQIECGHTHTAALRSDGRVYAVGQNPDGRCDTRQWRDVIHIACGVRHTLAVTAEGTCAAAGDNRYGQCDVSAWKGITAVAAGEFHTVGLRADGRVEAVGDNRRGQCHVEDLRDIISVACLPDATLCVRADGRVIIRGGSGELNGEVEAIREAVAIRTCEYRIAALTVDRRVVMIPHR